MADSSALQIFRTVSSEGNGLRDNNFFFVASSRISLMSLVTNCYS